MKRIFWSSFQSLRPKQWVKNLLLLIAPFSAGLGVVSEWGLVILGILAFCIAASIGYVINDLSDIEIDRLHPKKNRRPFASGALTIRSGKVIVLLLSFFLLLVITFLPGKFNFILSIYILNTFVYTRILKSVPVVEMFTVASGFILRLIAGAIVIDLVVSVWLIIVGGFGSLFIVGTKRLAEFKQMGKQEVRPVIKEYTSDFLQTVITFSMATSTTGYALWAFSDSDNLILHQISLAPFTLLLFRYKWLSEISNVEAPEDVLFSDLTLMLLGILLFTLLVFSIY